MNILLSEYQSLLAGAAITVGLIINLLWIGLFLGLFLAILEVYGNNVISWFSTLIQKILRGVPPIVLLILGYFGITTLIELPSFWVAVIVLGIISASYQSQIFRGAIQAIETEQILAARSIGMGTLQAILYIIIPQAIRLAIGAWTNEFASASKTTSLAYSIGVLEILRRGRFIISYSHGNAMLIYCTVAVFYFIIIRAGNTILYRLENKLSIPGFEIRAKTKERL